MTVLTHQEEASKVPMFWMSAWSNHVISDRYQSSKKVWVPVDSTVPSVSPRTTELPSLHTSPRRNSTGRDSPVLLQRSGGALDRLLNLGQACFESCSAPGIPVIMVARLREPSLIHCCRLLHTPCRTRRSTDTDTALSHSDEAPGLAAPMWVAKRKRKRESKQKKN